ncbi:unnamed protein product [Linum tenue]|uniref:Uncharacterized protein n=1 Tax=Linum tenue TaxID=586396 RepID=A0AAV0L401_9ROSI|nr:unnamed protein product [Linum tenue]
MAGVTMWRRLVLKYIIPEREKRPVVNGGVSKEKYEELKKMVSNKDKELGKLREDMECTKLRKEKEELKAANAAETRMVRDQLSQLQQQEQRRNQPWVWTGATRFLKEYTVDVRTRRPMPRDSWGSLKVEVPSDCYYVYEPSTNANSSPFPMINWLVVNEEPNDWPPPPKTSAVCQPGQFDKDNWWFVKIAHPGGRLAMMAYYDGNQTSYTTPNYLYPIRLPFPRNSRFSQVHSSSSLR